MLSCDSKLFKDHQLALFNPLGFVLSDRKIHFAQVGIQYIVFEYREDLLLLEVFEQPLPGYGSDKEGLCLLGCTEIKRKLRFCIESRLK